MDSLITNKKLSFYTQWAQVGCTSLDGNKMASNCTLVLLLVCKDSTHMHPPSFSRVALYSFLEWQQTIMHTVGVSARVSTRTCVVHCWGQWVIGLKGRSLLPVTKRVSGLAGEPIAGPRCSRPAVTSTHEAATCCGAAILHGRPGRPWSSFRRREGMDGTPDTTSMSNLSTNLDHAYLFHPSRQMV